MISILDLMYILTYVHIHAQAGTYKHILYVSTTNSTYFELYPCNHLLLSNQLALSFQVILQDILQFQKDHEICAFKHTNNTVTDIHVSTCVYFYAHVCVCVCVCVCACVCACTCSILLMVYLYSFSTSGSSPPGVPCWRGTPVEATGPLHKPSNSGRITLSSSSGLHIHTYIHVNSKQHAMHCT